MSTVVPLSKADGRQWLRLRQLRVQRAREALAQAQLDEGRALSAVQEREASIDATRQHLDGLARHWGGAGCVDLPRWAEQLKAHREAVAEKLERDEYALLDEQDTLEQAQAAVRQRRLDLARAQAREQAVDATLKDQRRQWLLGQEQQAELEAEDSRRVFFPDPLMHLLMSLALPLPEEAPTALPQRQQDDWQNAYLRLREQGFDGEEEEEPRALEQPLPPLTPFTPLLPLAARQDEEPEVKAAAPLSETPTVERIRQLAEPAANAVNAPPVPRSWQIDLPAIGPAWQLQVQQLQPQAPLVLELRVPPVAQSQARQQLADLDRRLRETGHDVLRTRLRTDDKRQTPVDEVQP